MAKLTERMPLTEGTNRVIDDPASPSAVGAIADFANSALTGYMNLRQDVAAEKARKKKAEAEELENNIWFDVANVQDNAIKNTVQARQLATQQYTQEPPVEETPSLMAQPEFGMGETSIDENGVFTSAPLTSSPALMREVDFATQRAANLQAAVEQGKIPNITLNASINAEFRRLRDKWGPAGAKTLIDAFAKYGLDANISTEAKDAVDWSNFERESQQGEITATKEREETYIKSAEEAFGPEALKMSRAEKIKHGMKVTQDAFNLKKTQDQYALIKTQTELNESQKAAAQKDLDNQLKADLISGSFNASQPFIQNFGRLIDAMGVNPNDPTLIQRFQAMAPEAKMNVDRYVESAIAVAQSSGYTGDINELRTTLHKQWEPILNIFSGDFSVASSKINALKSIETSMKIDTATALPLYTALSTAGFDLKSIPSIMQGLETDTEMMTALGNELKGYRQDLLSDGGSARFRRILGILRGEDSLAYAKPGQLAKELPNLVNTTRELAKNYIRDPKAVDGDLVINGVGELTTQIRTLGPSNSANTFYVATRAFAGSDVRKALINTLNDGNVDAEMASATIQASRAASAQMLNYYRANLGNINKVSSYYKVVWDDKDGKYKLDRSGQRAAIAAARRNAKRVQVGEEGRFGRMAAGQAERNFANAPVPEEIERFIQGANVNLENAIELGRYDKTTPQATELELRNWYGQERPLPNKGQSKSIDVDKEIDKLFDAADKSMDQLREDVGSRRVSRSSGNTDYTKAEGYGRNAPVVKEAAAKHGVPETLALALVGKESSFNEDAEGPVIKSGTHKGDRAMGLGQVMAKTAAAYGITNRASLNPAQQADLAMRVLKDNFESTGNWKDAVSMYFTGVNYATAKKQGRTDGFSTVMQYVEDIL